MHKDRRLQKNSRWCNIRAEAKTRPSLSERFTQLVPPTHSVYIVFHLTDKLCLSVLSCVDLCVLKEKQPLLRAAFHLTLATLLKSFHCYLSNVFEARDHSATIFTRSLVKELCSDIHCECSKSIDVTYTIDIEYLQWISERNLCLINDKDRMTLYRSQVFLNAAQTDSHDSSFSSFFFFRSRATRGSRG